MELKAFLFIMFVYLITPEDKNIGKRVKVNSPMYGTFEGCIIQRMDKDGYVYLIRKRFGGYEEVIKDDDLEITDEKC